MKHLIPLFCFSLLVSFHSFAQQPHFIYLQTDNNQPFYVLLKNKNYSSSSIDYVILPKLENRDYRIKVVFAKNHMPEQDYLLKVKDNDQGYLIKNFGEKGSGIFNLQTLAIQYSGEIGKQLDAVANAQREAERQKVLLQQRKDSTDKAEAALAEQRRIDNEAKLAAAAAKQKEDALALEKLRVEDSIKADNAAKIAAINQKKDADALAKKQAADNIKAENEAKLAAAKQKKDAAAFAQQQHIDSIKAVNAAKIATARQKALAKHEADSIAKAAAIPQVAKAQPKIAETLAQKKIRLAKEAEAKKTADALLQQHIADSTQAAEAAKIAALEQQKKDEAALLAKQQADEQARIEAQKKQDAIIAEQKAAADLQRRNDSLAAVEKAKLQLEQNAISAKKDSSLIIANPNSTHLNSNNVNATIVYEPQILNRVATDSGTIMTYKIPSSKGWDTVTAFIKEAPTEKKVITEAKPVVEKQTTTETTSKSEPDGVKFLDIHFKQDSANKSTDLIKPVFNEGKPVEKVVADNPAPKTATTTTTSTATPIANSNCRAEATEKDFFALRKKMVGQNDADNMIMVAKKSMREKCYTTLQIRNLSTLLITDAERYQFLEAAYPFASDAYNYAALTDLLKDNYYVERFKVMLKR